MNENSFEAAPAPQRPEKMKRPPEYVYIQKALIEHTCSNPESMDECAMNWITKNGKKFADVWPKIEQLPGGIERFKNDAEKEEFLKEVEGVLSEEI